MAGGVNEIQEIIFAVFCTVGQAYGLAFDRYASFPFNVHGVKKLVVELAVGYHIAKLDKAVSQGGFAVVNVSNDTEISNIVHMLFYVVEWGVSTKSKLWLFLNRGMSV